MEAQVNESVLESELTAISNGFEFFPVISDAESCQQAIERIRRGKDFVEKVKNYFNPDIEKANALHKSLTKKRRDLIEPVEADIKYGETEISKYRQGEQVQQRQEQERLMAEQRAQAEEAKKKLAAEIFKSGDFKKSEAILRQQTVIAPVSIAAAPNNGEKQKNVWTYELTDKMLLIKAIAGGLAPLSFVELNEVEIKKGVNLLKVENPYPGVKAWETLKVTVR